jgi:hypothetical protein
MLISGGMSVIIRVRRLLAGPMSVPVRSAGCGLPLRTRWTTTAVVSLTLLLTVVFVLSSAGPHSVLPPVSGASTISSGAAPIIGLSGGSGNAGVLASCSVGDDYGPSQPTYDPADGYIYVTSDIGISIVKPPCTVVKTIHTPEDEAEFVVYGTAYDPLTKEVVVTDWYRGAEFVLRGTSLVTTVHVGGWEVHCPGLEAWDPAVKAILITDAGASCGGEGGSGGIDILHLSIVGGTTLASTIVDAFDQGNSPTAVLVADGYVFSAGIQVNVYNDRTFAYVGSFALAGPNPALGESGALAWDPINDTVVLGLAYVVPRDSVIFLNASSISYREFTFHRWHTENILDGGVAGVGYSPATQKVYLTAESGPEVWELSRSGKVSHISLETASDGISGSGITYDPESHDTYVSDAWGTLYVLR